LFRDAIPAFECSVTTSRFIAALHQFDLLGTLHLVIDTLEKFLRVSGIKLDRERK
jgi:hypothetical protein